jgi:hypothetical protein
MDDRRPSAQSGETVTTKLPSSDSDTVESPGEPPKKGRGRPKGARNGQRKSGAPIKRWKPVHDLIVSLHVSMRSNKEIAEMLGCTPTTVTRVLTDPAAKEKIRIAQESLREKLSQRIEEGLVALCIKALDNIRQTIELEGLAYGSDFKKHQDKVSLEVLKGRGFLNKEPPAYRQGISLDSALATRLIEAIKESEKAAGHVIEGSYELVEESGE